MRKYIIGSLIGAVLMIGITAYADSIMIGKKVDGTFIVTLNDEILENEAIVIEGTSYLPVREFSEKVGYDVSFDPKEGIGLRKDVESVDITNELNAIQEFIEESSKEKVPSLEYYNSEIKNINVFLEGHKKFNNLTPEMVEEFTQEKARLEAEREQYYGVQ